MKDLQPLLIPVPAGAPEEIDYSGPGGDDFESLSRDRVPVRSLRPSDLPAIRRIDAAVGGRERSEYLARLVDEALRESAIRVSLVAEVDGRTAGFVMARMDFGEFGRTEPLAVIDTLGVDPAFARQGVGKALLSQLFANLAALHIETVETQISRENFALLGFLYRLGFQPSQRLAFAKTIG